MFSNTVEDALTRLDEATAALDAVSWDGLPAAERLEALERLETTRRRQTACAVGIVGSLERDDRGEIGPSLYKVIADVLRVSLKESRQRLRDAAQLTARTSITGQQLPPELPATAKAWDAGLLDAEHLRVIQKFVRELPWDVTPADAADAEVFLAEQAGLLRPDQLQKLAAVLALKLNPDGNFRDEDRNLRRGFTWCGAQRADGMSVGRLIATPQLRAEIEAWFAKFAAPGMCNPADQSPIVTGEPSQDIIDRDARSCSQRQHDALSALLRGQLGDPKLGQHNGLPVTIIASATVDQLESAAGYAVTAGGARLPIRDLIRMAGHSYHYLTIFDGECGRPLYLGRAKRIATADQRIVLHAKDRGCTAPGCDVPGYLTEVHHVDEWSDGGLTNVDRLTFACGPHHRLIKPGGWRTRKRKDGTTEWIPPQHLPLNGGVNSYHHPERLLPTRSDE